VDIEGYEIIRAKTLYSAEARKVGSGIRSGRGKVEYGPHIPTLVKQVKSGELNEVKYTLFCQ